jgi:uncharacterized membrane protein (UPF0127 family)
LISELEVAETAWRRLKGLIGRSSRDFQKGKGLWIYPSEGIHTIGLSFPIDVAYLDSEHRVVHIYHRLPPFRFARVILKSRSILEMPAGTLADSGTKSGDLLQFVISEEG